VNGLARDELRRRLRARRAELPADAIADAGARLVAHVLGSDDWRRASAVAAFVGVRGEPPTAALLEAAWRQGKTLLLPRVRGDDLELVAVRGSDELGPGGFGLVEPRGQDAWPLAAFAPSLVLVPGLGFGRRGERIGFGRGFYDRALAPLRDRTDVRRVGVAFAAFVDPQEGPIPMAPHDVPMHAIVTERGWFDVVP
jgi:5-formyltetrahydrofolate cyclo-ligase